MVLICNFNIFTDFKYLQLLAACGSLGRGRDERVTGGWCLDPLRPLSLDQPLAPSSVTMKFMFV